MAISNTVIQIKKSGVTGNVPSSLGAGELALNYVDNKLFYKNASGGTSWFYGANNGPSFSTVSNGTSLITATAPNDILTFATANGISITTNVSTKIITVGLSGITSTPTFNVTGNIPTTSNTTGSLIVTGGIGVSDNVYSTGSQSVFRGNVNIGNVVTGSNYPLDVTSSGNDVTVRSYTSAAGAWFMAYSTVGYYAGVKYVGANGARNWFSGMGNGLQAYTIAMSIDGVSNRLFTIDTTGYISLAGAPGSESFRATPVANSVNYLQASGAATGNFPGLYSQGSDSTINIGYFAKGGGYHFFYGSNSAQLGILPTAYAVNYIGVTGAATGGYPTFSAQGSDANIGLMYDAKGSGNQYFRAQSSAIQFAIGSTANAVNYMMAYGSTAGNYPVLTSLGTDTNIGFVFNSKGSGAVAFQTNYLLQAQVSYTANAVNFLNFTGGATGAAPTISTLSYTDANVSMNITSQGFGVVNVNTGTGTIAKFQDRGTTTVNSPYIFRAGLSGTTGGVLTLPVSPILQSPDPSDFTFTTNAGTGGGQGGSTQVVIGHTASTVNYLRLTGSAANNAPSISVLGSDTNINLVLTPKGSGSVVAGSSSAFSTSAGLLIGTGASPHYIYSASANVLGFRVGTSPSYFQFTDNAGAIGLTTGNPFYFTGWAGTYTFAIAGPVNANAVNYLTVGTSVTGAGPTLYPNGSDANISLSLQPKGSGAINLVTGSKVNLGLGNSVSGIKIGNSGSGYTGFPTVIISASNAPSGGTTAVASAIGAMKVTNATVVSGGTGYAVNDVLTVVGGTTVTSSATLTVTAVSGNVITAVSSTNFGAYSVLPTNPVSTTSSSAGTGATFTLGYGIYSGTVTLSNVGSGYVEQPSITFTGAGTPTIAATGFATVGSIPVINTIGSALSFNTPSGEQFRINDSNAPAVNYLQMTGGASGISPSFAGTGTDASVGLSFTTKSTGNMQFNSNGFNNTMLLLQAIASSVNYLNIRPSITNSPVTLNANGSDANVGLSLIPKGTGSVIVTGPMTVANTVNAVSQFAVSLQPNFSTSGTWANTAATFGGIAAGGSSAAAAVGIAFDTTTGGQLVSVAPGQGWYNMRYGANQHTFQNAGATHFNIINTSSAVNFLQVTGGAANNEPLISAQGSDANVALALQSKGSGGIDFAAGADGISISNGNTVTSLKLTSIGSGYTTVPTITIAAPTITGGVTATANVFDMGIWGVGVSFGGTGYSVNDTLTLVGGTVRTYAVTLRVTTISANVVTGVTVLNYGSYSALPTNPISVTGGTGTGANLSASWCVYGVNLLTSGSGYVEQPTVTFSTGGGAVAAIGYATVGSVANIKALGSQLNLQTANNQTSIQLLDDATMPIVNTALYVIGASSGLGRLGLRSNKAFYMSSGSSNPIGFFTNGSVASDGSPQLNITHTSSVNYLNITGGITNGAPVLSAVGSDTNVSIFITPKGTGNVTVTSTTAATSPTVGALVVAGGIGVAGAVVHGAGTVSNPSVAIGASNRGFYNPTNGDVGFVAGGYEQVRYLTTSPAVNYLTMTGSNTAVAPIISVAGSDTNVSILISPKGTGSVALGGAAVANSSLQVTSVTNSVNYIKVDGGVLGSGPQIAAVGYDTNLSLGLFQKGTGAIYLGGSYTYPSVLISTPTGTVNSFQMYGNSTGNGVSLNAIGADANVGISIGAKGTGSVVLAGNGQQIFAAINASGTDFTNYYNTTGQLNYTAAGGSTNINFAFTSKGTGSYIFTTGGGRQAQITDTTSAVNYLQFTGAANTASPTISAQGSDSNINLTLTAKGTGGVITSSNVAIGSTVLTLGKLFVSGGAIVGDQSHLSRVSSGLADGSRGFRQSIDATEYLALYDDNTSAILQSGGTTRLAINHTTGVISLGAVAGSESLRVSPVANSVNYWQFYGGAINNAIAMYATGSDTNINVNYVSKGASGHYFLTNSPSSAAQFFISPTASSVNYVQVTGSISNTASIISTGGSDANISLALSPKGTGNVQVTSTTASTSNTTGALIVAGGLGVGGNTYLSNNLTIVSTGGYLNTLQYSQGYYSTLSYFGVTGSGSFAGMQYNATPATGGVNHNFTAYGSPTSQGQNLFLIGTAPQGGTSVNYLSVTSNTTGNSPVFSALGSDTNINLSYTSKGTGGHTFITGGGLQFAVGNLANTTNYLQAQGAPTGSSVGLSAQGVDTNVSVGYFSKNSGYHFFYTNGTAQASISPTASAVNRIDLTGSANSAAPIISAQGSDSNINLKLLPKGTGYLYVGNIVNIGGDYSIGATISAAGQTSAVVGTSLQGFYNAQTIDSTKTAGFNIFSSYISTAAAAFNVNTIAHYKAAFFTLGAGSSITNQYGFMADSGLTAATNNYGFYSSISAASGRYNFYASGTANNVFSGQTSLGGLVGSESLRVSPVANSVNYLSIAGGATNGGVSLSAQGSDANIYITYNTKGNEAHGFLTGGGAAQQFRIIHTNGVVNYINVTGSVPNTAPIISAGGSDANISLTLSPKGTGNVTITSTTASTSVNTGSLIVLGGLGVSGNVYANGIYAVSALYANGISVSGGGGTSTFPTLNVTGNIPSTSNTTGSLIVTGGVGVSGNVYAGTIYASGAQLTNKPTVVVYSMIFGGS